MYALLKSNLFTLQEPALTKLIKKASKRPPNVVVSQSPTLKDDVNLKY